MSAWRKRSHTYLGRRTPEVWYERDVPERPGTVQSISSERFHELERAEQLHAPEAPPLMRYAGDGLPLPSWRISGERVRAETIAPQDRAAPARRTPTSKLAAEAHAEAE